MVSRQLIQVKFSCLKKRVSPHALVCYIAPLCHSCFFIMGFAVIQNSSCCRQVVISLYLYCSLFSEATAQLRKFAHFDGFLSPFQVRLPLWPGQLPQIHFGGRPIAITSREKVDVDIPTNYLHLDNGNPWIEPLDNRVRSGQKCTSLRYCRASNHL
ncbi:hypothetical protein EDB86DRAFT_359546 [Lactarius hatsudake]|nr:hypothetical protein EDB86DRAFT_359546 [Lactarius hatsudake]